MIPERLENFHPSEEEDFSLPVSIFIICLLLVAMLEAA